MTAPTQSPPEEPKQKLVSLLDDLKMPEGHKPVTKKIASINHKHDRRYTAPGEIAHQLQAYDQEIATDPTQVRNYVTNKLIEISGCGDVKHELKALELLGKISDVGLFSENSKITVTHTNSADLEAAIRDRIKQLLDTDVIDVTPNSEDDEAEEDSQEDSQEEPQDTQTEPEE